MRDTFVDEAESPALQMVILIHLLGLRLEAFRVLCSFLA